MHFFPHTLELVLVTILVSLLFLGIVHFFFPRVGFLDKPALYGLKRKAVPYSIGIILPAIFWVITVYFFPSINSLYPIVIGLTVLSVIAFVDDYLKISPYLRLAAQVCVALYLVWSGLGITSITSPFGGALHLDMWRWDILGHTLYPLSLLLTVFWIMLVINAINWLDGFQGLVSGVGTITSAVYVGLSLILLAGTALSQEEIAHAQVTGSLSLVLFISVGIIWLYEGVLKKGVLGDSGTYAIGYLLAILSIFSYGKIATLFLVLGVPILDFFWVIFRRVWIEKRSPFQGDHLHVHHRLQYIGLSQRSTALCIYALSIGLGVLALVLKTKGKLYAILAFLILAALFFIGVVLVQKRSKAKKSFDRDWRAT